MQDIDHHTFMYIDQVVVPSKIRNWMYPVIVARFNVEFLLVLKLSHCACMRPRFPSFADKMLTFIRWDGANGTLSHRFYPCNHSLFFIVYHKSSNNRKALSGITICTDELDSFSGISLYS